MYKQFRTARFIISLAVTLGVGLAASPSWARFQQPKNLERPYNRQAAATRSAGCGYRTAERPTRLTALVPLGNIGLTTAARPTFHWHMPANTFKATEFVLYKVTQTAPIREEEMIRVRFPVNNQAGVVSFQLPEQGLVPALAVDQEYHWQVLLICDPEDEDLSGNQVANGWIKRIPLGETLRGKLARATPASKFEQLAEAGLWYDALQQLEQMRSQGIQACQVREKWQEIMAATDVKLEHIPYAPLTQP